MPDPTNGMSPVRDLQMEAARARRLMFAIAVFANLAFGRGIFILYLHDRGITLTQIGLLMTLQTLVMVILEVPLGVAADRTQRKYLLLAGLVLSAGLLCYPRS